MCIRTRAPAVAPAAVAAYPQVKTLPMLCSCSNYLFGVGLDQRQRFRIHEGAKVNLNNDESVTLSYTRLFYGVSIMVNMSLSLYFRGTCTNLADLWRSIFGFFLSFLAMAIGTIGDFFMRTEIDLKAKIVRGAKTFLSAFVS